MINGKQEINIDELMFYKFLRRITGMTLPFMRRRKETKENQLLRLSRPSFSRCL